MADAAGSRFAGGLAGLAIALLGLAGALPAAAAALERYSPVPDAGRYPAGVEISNSYRVLVKLAADPAPWDAARHATATYRLWPDYVDPETLPPKHAQTSVHVAQVDADARLRVRLELLDGRSIQRLRLKPTRYAEMEASRRQGPDWVEFELNPFHLARHVLVEINAPEFDGDALQDGLMFFLNPPPVVPPGRVLRLPPGVVDETSPYMDDLFRILIEPDAPWDALYIPQDTIVNGRIDVRKEGFTVAGRGMVVGSRWPFVRAVDGWRERYPSWISPNGTPVKPLLSYTNPWFADHEASRFEGVLVAHPYHQNIGGAWHNVNLKAFAWRFGSDGVHGQVRRGIFTRVNDDAVHVGEGVVEDSTFWAMANGAVFQLGWMLREDDDRRARVRRVDVVRGEWDNLPNPGQDMLGAPRFAPPPDETTLSANRAVFAGTFREGGRFEVSRKEFRDVRVDFQANRLFYLGSRSGQVNYANLVFRDIHFERQPHYQSVSNVLSGLDYVKGIRLADFQVGGERLRRLDQLEPLEQNRLRGVRFH